MGKLTGTPLEPFLLSMYSDITYGENNYLGIVKKKKIGQSAAKYPKRIKVQRLVRPTGSVGIGLK